jgi:tetratricopeptide (TPR) repeat protein
LLLILIAGSLCTQARADQLGPPKLTPTPSTDQQKSLIKEGIALHDSGDYDGAIRLYEQVLAENPGNVVALYELGFSYSVKKDYRKSLETAYKGAQYKSDLLPGFYVLIGNNLDVLGEPQKAVEAYKAGIKLQPTDALLHYNLALAYVNLKKPEEARKSLKTALTLNPKHPGSHLLLADQFFSNGYKTPALFAAARFLVLEPKTPRAARGVRIMQEVLRGGVSPGKNPNEINIFVELSPKKDEGDFSSIDMLLGLTRAAGSLEKNQGKSEIQLLVEQMDTFLAILSEQDQKKNQSAFVYRYYVPYFIEMKQKGFVEPFVYYTFQKSNADGVGRWLEQNSGRVMQFLVWSNQYQWPTANSK